MRSYVVLIVTVVSVLLFDFWGQRTLGALADQGESCALRARQQVEAGDWAAAEVTSEQLERFFAENHWLLTVLVEHSQADEIETLQARLAVQISQREKASALDTLAQLALDYRQLIEGIRVNWGNII